MLLVPLFSSFLFFLFSELAEWKLWWPPHCCRWFWPFVIAHKCWPRVSCWPATSTTTCGGCPIDFSAALRFFFSFLLFFFFAKLHLAGIWKSATLADYLSIANWNYVAANVWIVNVLLPAGEHCAWSFGTAGFSSFPCCEFSQKIPSLFFCMHYYFCNNIYLPATTCGVLLLTKNQVGFEIC